MKVEVLNQKGEKVKDLTLDQAFDAKISDKALTLYINYLRNALRGPVANTKDRSEVSGGGKKPFKQKGTGRARQGSTRSPLWVGGGVTFGPTSDQNFRIRINKSLKRKAILACLGEAFSDKKAVVLDTLAIDDPKTKNAVNILSNVKAEGKVALLFSEKDENARRAFGNIAGINLMTPMKLDILNIISTDKIVISESSLDQLKEIYNK
ncbi:MAG: 50S ribosomal protein L4 [Patescibacteria group bacterium]